MAHTKPLANLGTIFNLVTTAVDQIRTFTLEASVNHLDKKITENTAKGKTSPVRTFLKRQYEKRIDIIERRNQNNSNYWRA